MTSTKKRGRTLLIVDKTQESIVGLTWRVGAQLFKKHFDTVVFAPNPGTVYDVLASYPHGGLDHIQVWGHGAPGVPMINGKGLDPGDIAWSAAAGGVVWFRSCKVLQGLEGHEFTKALTRRGVSVAGHLSNIGWMGSQSNLVAVRAGQQPWWPVTAKPEASRPWFPRTVMALDMRLPEWAFKA